MASLATFSQGISIQGSSTPTSNFLKITNTANQQVVGVTNQVITLSQQTPVIGQVAGNVETLLLDSANSVASLSISTLPVGGGAATRNAGVDLRTTSAVISANIGAGAAVAGISLTPTATEITSVSGTTLALQQEGGSSAISISGPANNSTVNIASSSVAGGITNIAGNVTYFTSGGLAVGAKDTVDFTAVNVLGITTGAANFTQYSIPITAINTPVSFSADTLNNNGTKTGIVNNNGAVTITIDGVVLLNNVAQTTAAASSMILASKSVGVQAVVNTIASVPGAATTDGEVFLLGWSTTGALTVTLANINGGTLPTNTTYIANVMVTHNSAAEPAWRAA